MPLSLILYHSQLIFNNKYLIKEQLRVAVSLLYSLAVFKVLVNPGQVTDRRQGTT